MNVGIIGTGNMASSLIKGFLTGKRNNILCSDIDVKKLKNFSKVNRVRVTTENIKVIKNSQIIFMCVKPQIVDKILVEIKKDFTLSKVLVSIVAGVQTSYIEKQLKRGSKIIRTMPNLPCSVLRGIFAYKANKNCKPKDVKIFKNLADTVGISLSINREKDFDTVTALSGSGPGFLGEYIAAQLDYAKSSGLNTIIGKKLIFETIVGTVEYLSTTNTSPKKFVDLVSSPGGTTEAGVDFLNNKKFSKIIYKCLESASDRSRKISNKVSLKKDY